jgi:hypothetical protein
MDAARPRMAGRVWMGDQQKWFKLWHSGLSDDKIAALPPALRWAWAALGAHTKVHGTGGRVIIGLQNEVLAAAMGIAVGDLVTIVKRLPHLDVEEGEKRHGEFTVTWRNWRKYQEDSTAAARQRASRAKRRGEEKRLKEPPIPPVDQKTGGPKTGTDPAIGALRRRIEFLKEEIDGEVDATRRDDLMGDLETTRNELTIAQKGGVVWGKPKPGRR